MQVNLCNKKILITREKKQAEIFAKLIQKYNGIPIQFPLLKIETLESTQLKQINFYEVSWIFFTSSNGVESFFKLMEKENNLDKIVNCHIAAVGSKTAEALTNKQKKIDFIPTKYNAETMAEEFSNQYPESGKILLVRGNLSRDVLPREFAKKGYDVEKIEVYKTRHITYLPSESVELIEEVDFLTFTSPSTIEAFSKVVNANNHFLQIPAVCIGTTTAASAKNVGFKTIITPEVFTIESMLEALHKYIVNRKDMEYENI